MRDHDIIAIWEDNIDLMREEFKEEFNNISNSPDNHGLHTFVLSRYQDYTIFSEVVYVIILEKCALFLSPSYYIQLKLDDELQVISGDVTPDSLLFVESMYGEIPDVEFLGPIIDSIGNWYDVFSLKYENPLNESIELYEHDRIPLDNISLDDDYLLDSALKYLAYRIEAFAVQVEKTLDNEVDALGIEENPLQNAFFDREVHMKMMREKRVLGNNDV